MWEVAVRLYGRKKTKDEVTAEWQRHAFVACPKCGSTHLIEYAKGDK